MAKSSFNVAIKGAGTSVARSNAQLDLRLHSESHSVEDEFHLHRADTDAADAPWREAPAVQKLVVVTDYRLHGIPFNGLRLRLAEGVEPRFASANVVTGELTCGGTGSSSAPTPVLPDLFSRLAPPSIVACFKLKVAG